MAPHGGGAVQVSPLHAPLVHVRVCEPLATPYGHDCVQVLPEEVVPQVPDPYCGAANTAHG